MKLKKSFKQYLQVDKITTNSLWVNSLNNKPIFGKSLIPKRDNLPKSSKDLHGVWIAQIPYQFISRLTQENDVIWSPFGGSGIDYQVANILNRKCIINDINIRKDYILYGDARDFDPGQKVDLILCHPPYWDIVKYSDDDKDGSSKKTLMEYAL